MSALKRLFTAALCLVLAAPAFAQSSSKTCRISGSVRFADTDEPVEYAGVLVAPHAITAATAPDGTFDITNIPAGGQIKLSVQFFGMKDFDTTFVAKTGMHYRFDIKMQEMNFRLEEVVVTAKKSEAGASTASEISRQAMDHMQTSSLKDVMTLLPGVSLSNPSLSSSQTITIRNNAGASSMNSLGTAIIVDGSPLSNNANLQVLSTAQGGSTSTSAGGGSASTGVDIRSLSTDNVESVEVIRGIPSVQYGDLTSGAVIVKSKAGESPLTLRFKTNPNIYQASAAKGFKLGGKLGNLNVSGDYAYNRSSLTEAFDHYERASAKALWSYMPSTIVSTNTSLTLNYGKDESEWNQDLAMDKSMSHATELGFILNTNGHASINGEWLKSINWAVSGSFTNKDSHFEDTASNAMNLYSTSMTDGQTYTAVAGQQIYDFITGEEITNASSTGVKGTILPYSYYYTYDVYGKEINGFAKLNAEFSHTWGGFTDKLLVGADYKTDGNLGKGSVYNDDTPPYRNISNVNSGYRRRPYYDIPFVNQISAYAEDQMVYKFGERTLNLSAGARLLDIISGDMNMTSVDPRINASVDIFPWMTMRAGWGYASKAPTSIYLNPNYAYLDEINYNGMGVNTPESEQLLVATTHIYDSKNPDLKIARNRKAEIGLDFKIADKYTVSLTGYDELMKNGYSYGLLQSSFIYFVHQAYTVAQENPGSIPSLTKGDTTRSFFQVYKPGNNVATHNSGVEYEIDLGRFDAIRTSFYINGAWMRGESWGTNNTYNTSSPSSGTRKEFNIAVYEPGMTKAINEEHVTTLRMTHNIPEIGFVVTLTAQANWGTKFWDEYNMDYVRTINGKEYTIFNKYLSYETGKVEEIEFSEDLLSDDDFSYLFSPSNSTRYTVYKYDPYVILNLNLTKEIGDAMTASFYVNNLFNYRHLWTNPISGGKVELGIPMYFGFELKVNIR